jgi:hypothetical protein
MSASFEHSGFNASLTIGDLVTSDPEIPQSQCGDAINPIRDECRWQISHLGSGESILIKVTVRPSTSG